MPNARKEPAPQSKATSRFEHVIRGILHERRMTLIAAAYKLGYDSAQGLTNVLQASNPQLNTLLNIAEGLDINPAMLISRLYPGENQRHYDPENVMLLPYLALKNQSNFTSKKDLSEALGSLPTYPVSRAAFDGRPSDTASRHMVVQVPTQAMAPELPERSAVVSEMVDPEDYPYLTGGVYAVVHGGQLLVSRIKQNNIGETGELTMVSDNNDYGSVTIPAKSIRFMGKVLGVVEKPVE